MKKILISFAYASLILLNVGDAYAVDKQNKNSAVESSAPAQQAQTIPPPR